MPTKDHNVSPAWEDDAHALKAVQLSFIGCGAMAEAMIAGLLRERLIAPAQISGSHPRAARREYLEGKYSIRLFENNREAAISGQREDRGDSIIVLAVKPQRMGQVLKDLRETARSHQLILSIAAGVSTKTISEELSHRAVVRAMPNTPAQIGQGMTVWFATPEVSQEQQTWVRELLGALGHEMHVETERMIDMATALSATGPTYIFLMMEALVDAGVHLGFSRHVAQELVLQTMRGSVRFALETEKHPAELRNMVTSPGGTSAEAIYQMEKGGFRTVLSKAVWAAYQRSVSLGTGDSCQ